MTVAAPIILVPGFWLGAWAWDEVVALLRAEGHDVTALTLPGLDSAHTDRSGITIDDHVETIVSAVRAAPAPVVLAVHSGAGFPGYAASDRVPELIAAMVYVDTGAGVGAMDADFEGDDKPMVWSDIEANEDLTGLSEEQRETFRERAVPQPGGVLRGSVDLVNDARLDIPTTVVATAYSVEDYKDAVDNGYDFVAGLKDVRNIEWVELRTSHWPMWSRPKELAEIIGTVARAHSTV